MVLLILKIERRNTMRYIKRRRIIITVLALVFYMSEPILAQQRKPELPNPYFYNGPVTIQSASGTIELQRNEYPKANIELNILNNSQKQEEVSIGFRGSDPVKISLNPQSMQKLVLSPLIKHSGNPGSTQKASIDLVPEINGTPSGDPIDDVNIMILLPTDVPALIRSNTSLKKDSAGGLATYRLNQQRVYLTELSLVYTLGPITLSIDKEIMPSVIDKKGPVNISLTIRNLGSEEAKNILLKDNFNPEDFSAGDSEGFEFYKGKDNDQRLLWFHTVNSIPAGGSIIVKYNVNALLPIHDCSLNAVTASINGQLVGVSNKIKT